MERRSTANATPPVEPRPAATIVLVRPGQDGLEVLLTRRPDSMAFAAGLHVFPGGRVEPGDADPDLVRRARGATADPGFQVAHRIAAIRETWEEVGVLLASPGDSGPARRGGIDFAGLVAAERLELRTDDLVEIARWTTPRAFPRRFDTRFFAAELPRDAVLAVDPGEVAGHDWLTPRAALARMRAGEIAMWPPTSTTLQRLERAASFDAIRGGLVRTPEPPISVEQLEPGLCLLRGQNAIGRAGRPANTVLVGRRDVTVVDPGDPGEAFLDSIEAEVARGGGRIAAIALTHVDPGHASGSEELRARWDVPILVGPGGADPLSWLVTEIADGALVGVGDGRLNAVALPGHRPDHLGFLAPGATLLSGDALTDRPTLILGPEGDLASQRRSLALVRRMLADGTVRRIVPGHGSAVLADPVGALDRALADPAVSPAGSLD